MSVANFQKLPSAGGSPSPAPHYLSMLVIWSCLIWPNCGFLNWLWQNWTLKKSVMMSFQWRHQRTSQNFPFWAPLNLNFWLCQ